MNLERCVVHFCANLVSGVDFILMDNFANAINCIVELACRSVKNF